MSRPPGSPYPHRLELYICDAIAGRRLITFDYNGIHRVAQPYCHGFTRAGAETLRALEVGGRGRSFGKLWTVAKMQNLRLTADHFTPDDPDYNPDDSAMAEIHCRVKALADLDPAICELRASEARAQADPTTRRRSPSGRPRPR